MNYLFLSKKTLFFSIIIVVSASSNRAILDCLTASIGRAHFILFFDLSIIAVAFLLLIFFYIYKSRSCFLNKLIFPLLVIIPICYLWQIPIAEEKIHLPEYALLGAMVCSDIYSQSKKYSALLFVFLICLIVSFSDELFQLILPYRYYDNRDILFNSLGSLWGMSLYLVLRKKDCKTLSL